MFIQKGSLNLRVEGAPTVSVTVKTLNPTKVSILNPPHATISHISDTAAINDNGRSAPFLFPPLAGFLERNRCQIRTQRGPHGARLPQNRPREQKQKRKRRKKTKKLRTLLGLSNSNGSNGTHLTLGEGSQQPAARGSAFPFGLSLYLYLAIWPLTSRSICHRVRPQSSNTGSASCSAIS